MPVLRVALRGYRLAVIQKEKRAHDVGALAPLVVRLSLGHPARSEGHRPASYILSAQLAAEIRFLSCNFVTIKK
jgi:hypothetical protein